MTRATQPYRNRIALIFDFDSTLGPSTYHKVLSNHGYNPGAFIDERVKPLIDDEWDEILARYHALIQASRNGENPITKTSIETIGKNLDLYPDVEHMFEQVRTWVNDNDYDTDITVEFYMLTAGMIEVPAASTIADKFKQIWAGECHFNDDGEIDFVKRIITHPEKNRYLIQLAKGLHLEGLIQPQNIHENMPLSDYYIPFDQMIYVGDGASDMSVFYLMEDKGGIAIGVVPGDSVQDWEGYDDMTERRRVQNLAVADYSEESELMTTIRHAVRSIVEKIALRKMSQKQ